VGLHVMLSRVRTKKGPLCQKELPRDLGKKCVVPESPTRKCQLRCFHEHAPTHWDDDECDEMFDLPQQQKTNAIPHVFPQQQLLPHSFQWSLEPNEETMGQLLPQQL